MKKVIKKNNPKKKSFFEQIKMLNKKTRRETKDTKSKTEAEQNELTRVANELRKKGVVSLNEIQEALKNNSKLKQSDAKIIDTILKCKTKEGRILLKDDTFAKQLSFYVLGNDVSTKYLTNDYLYLNMIASKFVFPVQENPNNLSLLLGGAILLNVTIVSQNFSVNSETAKGLIQDYDGNFSLICSKETQDDNDLIEDIITNRPNFSTFYLDGSTYEYYGTEEACIIQVSGTSPETVRERVNNMKFVHNENSVFVNGEKKVTADGKMKFINKKVFPESFCPSFWASPEPIKCDFLFEFALDYNVLFEYLERTKGDELILPRNICYWDNIKYFFDFLGVFYLTARDISESESIDIGTYIFGFKTIKDFCVAWKSQALNVQRVFQDFVNAFLNNSSFARFTFIYEKALIVNKSITELMKKREYNNFCSFLKKFKTLYYINNQLQRMPEIVAILSSVINCLRKYCEGSNPDTLWREIVAVANKILSYLPNNILESDALFPFICSTGGFHDNISGNKENNALLSVRRNVRKKIREKEQNKLIIKSISDTSKSVNKDLKQYFQNFVRGNTKDISNAVENALIDALYDYFISSGEVESEREKLIEYITIGTRPGRKTEALIDDMCRVFIGRTRNAKLTSKDKRVNDFIEENIERIGMLNSNFTFNPNRFQQRKEEKKGDNEEDDKNEEEKSENDEK